MTVNPQLLRVATVESRSIELTPSKWEANKWDIALWFNFNQSGILSLTVNELRTLRAKIDVALTHHDRVNVDGPKID